jgi:hypothetical protein
MKTDTRDTDHQLNEAELETVIGGTLDNCTRVPTINGILTNTSWTFKDVFAKPTLGTYH